MYKGNNKIGCYFKWRLVNFAVRNIVKLVLGILACFVRCKFEISFLNTGHYRPLFVLLSFFSFDRKETVDARGFDLGSSEKKASTLTTWPAPWSQIWNIVVLCFWKEVLTDSTSLTGWENHVWTVYFLKVKFWLWSNKNCDLFWGSQWLCYPKQISTRQMFKAEMFDQTNDRISTIPAIKIRMGHRLQRGNFYAMDQRILVKGTFGPRLNVKLDCR